MFTSAESCVALKLKVNKVRTWSVYKHISNTYLYLFYKKLYPSKNKWELIVSILESKLVVSNYSNVIIKTF